MMFDLGIGDSPGLTLVGFSIICFRFTDVHNLDEVFIEIQN